MRNLKLRKEAYFPSQWAFLTSNAPNRAFVAGFGGGKTFTLIRDTLVQHINSIDLKTGLSKGWVLYRTLGMAKEVFLQDFKDLLDKVGIKYTYNIQSMCFTSAYGTIYIKTYDDPSMLVGSNLTFINIDELDTISTDKAMLVYNMCVGRMRGRENAKIGVYTTPEGFKATYKIFVENATEKHFLVQSKTTDNKTLPKDYIENMINQYDDRRKKAYINGEFVNFNAGSVYYGFDRDKHIVDNLTINKNLPVCLFFDFNVFPNSAGYCQYTNESDIAIIGEWVLKGTTTTYDMCREIINTLPSDIDIVIYGDASGNYHSQQSHLVNYQIIKDELEPYFKSIDFSNIPRSNGAVINRIMCLNAKLDKDCIKINKDCVKLIKDLEQVVYNDRGDIDKTSNKELSHISDALGYFIVAKFPLIKPRITREPYSL